MKRADVTQPRRREAERRRLKISGIRVSPASSGHSRDATGMRRKEACVPLIETVRAVDAPEEDTAGFELEKLHFAVVGRLAQAS